MEPIWFGRRDILKTLITICADSAEIILRPNRTFDRCSHCALTHMRASPLKSIAQIGEDVYPFPANTDPVLNLCDHGALKSDSPLHRGVRAHAAPILIHCRKL